MMDGRHLRLAGVHRTVPIVRDQPTVIRWNVADLAAPTVPSLRSTRRPRPTRGVPVGISPWWHRVPLVLWTFVLQVVLYSNSGQSWHFFADGAVLLLGGHPPGLSRPGGLHLYANYPQLQIGPLALLAAAALLVFTTTGGWMIASLLMTLTGMAVLLAVEHLTGVARPGARSTPWTSTLTMLVGGASFLLSWELLAVHFAHLDDVLALALLAAAGTAVTYRCPTLAGVCVGLAADAKPWALACAALTLALPGRARWRAVTTALIVVVLAWAPFVVADPRTLHAAASFAIQNVPASGLRALGVTVASTPGWDRPAQIGIGCLLGAAAVARGRWQAVLALGIGTRIALDPSVYTYYTAGLALGLLWWDLVGYRRPAPVLSLLCLAGITVPLVLTHDPRALGELRLWSVLLATAILLAAPRDRPTGWPRRLRARRGRSPSTAFPER
jgi:hypothetical protein